MNTVKRPSMQEEFKRNPELKEDDLQHLREWCLIQPHYPRNIPDEDLIYFLHSNYYMLEPTKKSIEIFYTCRTDMTEVFSNRDPVGYKELRRAMDTLYILPLEQTTPEGYGIFYSRLKNFDVDRFSYYDSMRLYNMILDLWLIQHGTVKGHVFIHDLEGVQMSHALKMPLTGLKKFLQYIQEAAPIRIKAIHYLHTTSVIDFMLGLMRPFLKKELLDLIHLHPSVESIKKHIPIEILPNELDGKAGAISELYENVLKNLEDHREFFLAEEKEMRVDESLRPDKDQTLISILSNRVTSFTRRFFK